VAFKGMSDVAGLGTQANQSDNQANVKQQLFSDWLPIHLEAKLKRFYATGVSSKWHSRLDLSLNESGWRLFEALFKCNQCLYSLN